MNQFMPIKALMTREQFHEWISEMPLECTTFQLNMIRGIYNYAMSLVAELSEVKSDMVAVDEQADRCHAACEGYEVRILALEAALREAIEYVLLDTEIPRSVRDWQKVLAPNAGLPQAQRPGVTND
jgi:hypothetical protein